MQSLAARKIRERGFSLVLSDRNPEAVCRPLADMFLPLDTFDVLGHLTASEEVQRHFTLRAVLTTAADCHFTVASLAAHLGLHHLDPEISKICRNKVETRELLAGAGLYQPESHAVTTYESALEVLRHVDRTFVIKATDNSGSRGFGVIPRGQLLSKEQFERARRMGTTGTVLLEGRLEADPEQISEVSVETLWHDGKMYWINWVDRIFPRDLKFFPEILIRRNLNEAIELGHINPARHDSVVKKRVKLDIEHAGRALGMDRVRGAHILKADVFFSTNGPVILELTPRTSGGWDSSGSSPARGADIAGGVIHLALGSALDLNAWYQYFHYHDAERTAVVMSKIPDDAVDCLGRQFAIASGYEPVPSLINAAIQKLERGENIAPV